VSAIQASARREDHGVMSEELMVRHGAHVTIVSAARPFVVGRGSGADLRLTDVRVSRRHLMVRQTAAGWSVVDMSANGTWLEGERVRSLDLLRETRLNLGATNGPRITLIPGTPQSIPDYPLPQVPEIWPPEPRRAVALSPSRGTPVEAAAQPAPVSLGSDSAGASARVPARRADALQPAVSCSWWPW